MAKEKSATVSLIEDSEAIIKSATEGDTEPEYLETGNIGFDLALTNGKGIPIGCSVLLWAEPACGKSTVLADVSRRLLEYSERAGVPFKVLYLDIEGSSKLIRDMGLGQYIDKKTLIHVNKLLSWRTIEAFYNEVMSGKNPAFKDVKLIIIDSVNNIQSDATTSKSVADGDFGSRAKERTNFYSKFFPKCKELGITTFLISQVRQNLDASPMVMDKKKAAVSWADKHNVDIILKCSKVLSSPDTKKIETATAFDKHVDVVGYVFRMDSSANDCKNRFFLGSRAELYVNKGKNVDNAYALRKLLEFNNLINASGGWFAFSKDICQAFNLPDKKNA